MLKSYKEILIEQFIPGREIQACIIGKKKLGAIELKPKRKFYDYQAKYNSKAKVTITTEAVSNIHDSDVVWNPTSDGRKRD